MPATILLVDANSSNRFEWESLLRDRGYKVIAVESGKAALYEFREFQPDLVFVEVAIPDIDGEQLCRHLKADPATQLTPLVLSLPPTGLANLPLIMAEVADDFWIRSASRFEALNRIQAMLRLRTYVDRQTESVAFSLARSMDLKDRSTSGHCERVREYATQLGEEMELLPEDMNALRLASMLHDIGKIAVPDSILFKPGPLTAAETEVVRQHPVVGESICAPLSGFRDALPIIRHHHERMDGSGYPDRLAGDRIPLLARITQVVDIYDALTSDRPYRQSLSPEAALTVLAAEAARGWLDPSLVDRFTAICRSAHFPIRREGSACFGYGAPDGRSGGADATGSC
jgi:putative two-component system response regulator